VERFLPRYMECRRGLAMRKLSVRPSICPTVKLVICDKTKESCAPFLCENCQRHSCKAFIDLSICAKMIGGGRPLLRENLADTDLPLAKRRFLIYFARSTSAVSPSEKSSINTNIKSTTRFPMSVRRIVGLYVDPKPPKRALKRSVQNLNNNLR